MAKTGCATCSDLSSLARTINQIRDGQVAQTRELGIIVGQNRLILAELAAIGGAVGVGVAGDKLAKILAIISAVASTISAGAAVWSGLGKGELKKLLTETKKKANDAQYAATQTSIKSEEIRKQNLVLGIKVAELAAQNLKGYKKANDAAYASTQASIKADKINENIIQLSKNQNENLTIISNDIVQISDNLNRNLQTIFDNQVTPSIVREIKPAITESIKSESPQIIERVIQKEIPKIIKQESPTIAKEIAKTPEFKPVVENAPTLKGFMREVMPPEAKKEGNLPNWIKQWFVKKYAPSITWKPSELERYNEKIRKEIVDVTKKNSGSVISDELKKITGLITPLPALVTGLNPVKNPEVFNKISDAAATGVCRTTAPGGCMGRALNDLGDRNSQGLNNLGSKLDAANLASNAAQLALLKKIDATTVANGVKLGSQLANGGIGAKLVRLGDMLKLPQLLSVLTFISTVHNGVMLSTDFVQTLGALMDAGLQLILPKDSELGSISIQSILGKEFRAFLVNLIGVEQTNDLLQIWTKSSRIYQASASVLYNVTSLADSTKTITTSTLENLGKIGNALLDARVINPTAFPKMAENVTPNFVWDEKIAGLTAAATFLALIVGESQNIKDETENLKENSAKLQTAIDDATKPLKDLDKSKKSVSVTSENVDEIIDFGGLL